MWVGIDPIFELLSSALAHALQLPVGTSVTIESVYADGTCRGIRSDTGQTGT